MDGHLYVVDYLRHLAGCKAGDITWWCVQPSAKEGEHSAIYLKGTGIKILFRTITPTSNCDNFCQAYGLSTAKIEVLASFIQPITMKEIKTHKDLLTLNGVNQNFHGTAFRLTKPLFDAMLRMRPSEH